MRADRITKKQLEEIGFTPREKLRDNGIMVLTLMESHGDLGHTCLYLSVSTKDSDPYPWLYHEDCSYEEDNITSLCLGKATTIEKLKTEIEHLKRMFL